MYHDYLSNVHESVALHCILCPEQPLLDSNMVCSTVGCLNNDHLPRLYLRELERHLSVFVDTVQPYLTCIELWMARVEQLIYAPVMINGGPMGTIFYEVNTYAPSIPDENDRVHLMVLAERIPGMIYQVRALPMHRLITQFFYIQTCMSKMLEIMYNHRDHVYRIHNAILYKELYTVIHAVSVIVDGVSKTFTSIWLYNEAIREMRAIEQGVPYKPIEL